MINISESNKEFKDRALQEFWNSNKFHEFLPPPAFEKFILPSEDHTGFPELLKLGNLRHSIEQDYEVPLFIPMHGSSGVSFITNNSDNSDLSHKAIEVLAFRMLLSIPSGKCKFYIIDPENSGQSFQGLFGLDKRILEDNIWDDESEIVNGLKSIKESIPATLKDLLATKYKDLVDYNKQVAQSRQPFQFLLVSNFPNGFNRESTELLFNILKNGSKAGVHCFMNIDRYCPKPFMEFNVDKFRNISIEYDFETNKIINIQGEEVFNQHYKIQNLEFELPGNINDIKNEINSKLDITQVVEIETIEGDDLFSKNSSKGITVPLGINTSGKKQYLQLGDGTDVHHAFIGGATGKGKTVLLHNIIINAAKLYAPDELRFVLMDYKEGTEFNVYKKIPHVQILTSTSEIEFGYSVIEFLNEQIVERGNLFKEAGVSDFADYKTKTKEKLARYLVIIDEFQVLLNPGKMISSKISSMIEDLTRRGRSFGINLILSTQSLGDVELSASTLGQIGVRIAMSMPEHDCVRILNIDNDVPVTFTKAGQAIYNTLMGRKEGNIEFQVAFIDKNQIPEEVNLICSKVKDEDRKFIFDGSSEVLFEDNEILQRNIKEGNLVINESFSDIYLGEPFYLSNEHFRYRIRKQQESNVLIVGDDNIAAISTIYFSLKQLALQSSQESKYYLFNLFSIDSGLQDKFDNLSSEINNLSINKGSKNMLDIIEQVEVELESRYSDETRRGRIILAILNANSSRELRREEFGLSPVAEKLVNILKNGPELGIHTFLHSINKKSIEEIFDYNIYNEFENKILLKGINPFDFGSDLDDKMDKENCAIVISPMTKYSADKLALYTIN